MHFMENERIEHSSGSYILNLTPYFLCFATFFFFFHLFLVIAGVEDIHSGAANRYRMSRGARLVVLRAKQKKKTTTEIVQVN